jgi:hypothetical protein
MVVIVCNRCLSPLTLWVRIPLMVRCTWYNIIWKRLSVTCDGSVVFSGYIGFLHQLKWPPRYNWNIVESGVKHHNPNPKWRKMSIQIYSVSPFLWFGNWNLWYHTFTHCLWIFVYIHSVTGECLLTFTHYLWMFVHIYSLLVNVHYIYSLCLHLLITCECVFTFTHYLWMFVYIYSLLVNVHYIYSLSVKICLYSLCYRWMLAYIYSFLVNVCSHLLITCECSLHLLIVVTFTHYLWMCVHIYSLLVNVCSHLLITCKCLFTFTHYLWMFITFTHYLWKFVYIY